MLSLKRADGELKQAVLSHMITLKLRCVLLAGELRVAASEWWSRAEAACLPPPTSLKQQKELQHENAASRA